MDKNKFRVIFLFVYKLRKTASETARIMNEAFGEGSLPVRIAQRWFQRYRQGDERLNDVRHTGRKRSLNDDTLKEVVEAEPRNKSVNFAQNVGKTKSTISRHLREIGRKIRWINRVPHELTGTRKNDVTSSVQLYY